MSDQSKYEMRPNPLVDIVANKIRRSVSLDMSPSLAMARSRLVGIVSELSNCRDQQRNLLMERTSLFFFFHFVWFSFKPKTYNGTES
jgi:hypothetical protein